MAHAGDGAQAHDHLLVDDQDRDQQGEDPQEAVVVVLPRLGVGGDAAGVVVADHDDDPRADDGGQGEQALAPAVAFADVADLDLAEGAFDIPEVGRVEYGGRGSSEAAIRGRARSLGADGSARVAVAGRGEAEGQRWPTPEEMAA